METRETQVCCESCLDRAENSGQLSESAKTGSLVECGENCELCGGILIDGETYRVVLN